MPTMQRWRRMPARSLSGPSSHEPKKRKAGAGSSYLTIRDIPSPANRSTAPSGSSSCRLAPRPDAGKNILARIGDQNIRAPLQRDFRLLIDDPRLSGLDGLTCQGTAADERHDPHGLARRRLQFARAFHLPAFQHELGTIAQDSSSVPDLPRHMRRDIGHRVGHGDDVVEMKFAGAELVS